MSNKVESKDTDEEGVSNGDTKKTFGKFRFSLSSKNTSTLPKPESTKPEQPKTDPASLLASLKAEKNTNRSDEDTSNDATVSLKPIKPIKMKLVTSAPKAAGVKRQAQEAKKIAEVFNPDEQPEEEEMPPEAKMRMRNIGKDTPTASGPNSFNKGKLGFCNQAKMLEKQMKQAFEDAERSKKKF